jgi:hypothetical protein
VTEYRAEPALVRKAIMWELRSTRGELAEAVKEVMCEAESARSQGEISSAAWLFLKAAELLCNDCQDDAAWKIYTRLNTFATDLPSDLQAIAKQNFSVVGLNVGDASSYREFHKAVDQESQLQRPRDTEELLYAEQASRERKHYDSLPPLWRNLTASYLTGDWGSRKRAHNRLALETLAAGWIGQSVHHCLHGGNLEAVKPLTEWLIKWRNPDLVQICVRTVTSNTLCEFARIGAEIVSPLADVITENDLQLTIDWALGCANRPHLTPHNISSVTACWRCLGRLSFRFSEAQAIGVTSALLDRVILGPALVVRKVAVQVLRACLSHIGQYDWQGLAVQVLPLAREGRSDVDFRDVLDLLVVIAERDVNAKRAIADALAPRGSVVADLHLMRLLPQLGRTPQIEHIARFIKSLAAHIEEQVWSGTGAPPKPGLSVLMEWKREDRQSHSVQRVLFQAGALEMDVILANKDILDPEVIEPLISPIEKVVQDPLNVIENRLALFEFLRLLHDRISRDQAIRVCNLMLPFAEGAWTTTSPAQAGSPSTTERVQFGGPDAADQRAVALSALARIATTHRLWRRPVRELLSTAMLCPFAAVRTSACIALAELVKISRSQTVALIAAMQDPEIEVEVAAYQAIVHTLQRGARVYAVSCIVTVARRHVLSPVPAIRRQVALLAEPLGKCRLTNGDRAQLSQLITELQDDPHFSVRSRVRSAVALTG